jgi:hypothetical protein
MTQPRGTRYTVPDAEEKRVLTITLPDDLRELAE